jgi:ZIP family zinc transporter
VNGRVLCRDRDPGFGYLFFDLTHEAVEMTGGQDPLSWLAFLGSLCLALVGLSHWSRCKMAATGQPHGRSLFPIWIALGMGLHNLGEGLSLGAGYAQGAWV